MEEALQKLDLSEEESKQFKTAFEKPEFQKMFLQYAKDLSDPQIRAEREAELEKMEATAGLDPSIGKLAVIAPQPGFCVKSKTLDGSKIFINVCSSTKLDPPRRHVESGKSGSRVAPPNPAPNASIPFALPGARRGIDKNGAHCTIHEIIVHPDALRRCGLSDVDADTDGNSLADTGDSSAKARVAAMLDRPVTAPHAREYALSRHHLIELGRRTLQTHHGVTWADTSVKGYHVMRTIASKGDPIPAATVRLDHSVNTEVSSSIEKSDAEVVSSGDVPASESLGAAPVAAAAWGVGGVQAVRPEGTRSLEPPHSSILRDSGENTGDGWQQAAGVGDPSVLPSTASASPPSPADSAVSSSTSECPAFRIVHQHDMNMQDYLETRHQETKHPRALVITIELPRARSARELDLEIEAHHLHLESKALKYLLDLSLPLECDADEAKAKFDKSARKLVITVPTMPLPSQLLPGHSDNMHDSSAANAHIAPPKSDLPEGEDDTPPAEARKQEIVPDVAQASPPSDVQSSPTDNGAQQHLDDDAYREWGAQWDLAHGGGTSGVPDTSEATGTKEGHKLWQGEGADTEGVSASYMRVRVKSNLANGLV